MAVAAEAAFDQIVSYESWQPPAVAVTELDIERESRLKAARLIGSVMLAKTAELELPEIQRPIESLYEAIRLAADGDEDAKNIVYINARTDVVERTLKTGHVLEPIPLAIRSDGKISQYRQTMDSIQANSLRYAANDPVMRIRTEAETRNAFRMETLHRAGWFEDYSMLVISRAEDLPGVFFTETMSCSLQLTSKLGEDLVTEPAFVSGITGGRQHDEQTVVALGAMLGVDLNGKSAAEVLDTPILVRNDLVENGVIDIVRLYDEAAGGTFFGEDGPGEDYLAYRQQCARREREFEPKVSTIVDELLAEADEITSAEQAVRRLNKISGKHMVEHAMVDRTIDARVFGAEAAYMVEQGRALYAQGRYDELDQLTKQAVRAEKSFSCPTGMSDGKSGESQDNINTNSSEEMKDCDFVSKKCPICGEKNAKTMVRKGVYHHVGKGCRSK